MPEICSKCRKPNPTPEKSRCPSCANYGHRMVKQRRKRLRKLEMCYDCPQPSVPNKTRCESCLEKAAKVAQIFAETIKLEALNAYGGPSCACCQEDSIIMLTLDHTAQNGAEDRRQNGKSGTGFYQRLKKLGWPPGFRVLCRNCNYAVYFDPEHKCPHRTGCFSNAKDYGLATGPGLGFGAGCGGSPGSGRVF